MKDRQEKSELAIFEVFAELCPLKIRPASIVSRDPPEPDVLCGIGDGKEQVAFELVEIIDERWASLTSGQLREMASLREAYTLSTGDERVALDERLGNALVYVSFCADTPARRRRAAVLEILQYLSSIRPDYSGDWKPPIGGALHGTVRAIRISRGTFPGPEFDVEAVAAIRPSTEFEQNGRSRIRRHTRSSFSPTMNCNPGAGHSLATGLGVVCPTQLGQEPIPPCVASRCRSQNDFWSVQSCRDR